MIGTSVAVWNLVPGRPTLAPRGSEAASAVSATPSSPTARLEVGSPVRLTARLGHPVLLAEVPGETYVYAALEAVGASRAAAPSNLSIVLDRSGSMAGRRMENAIAGAQQAVRRLRDGDVVSVIAYDDVAEVVVAPTTIGPGSREAVAASLATIGVRGDTCISCGIERARALLATRSHMMNRLLLLSDGEATAGVVALEGFKQLAATCREAEISITSIGVDVTYNERVMAALAEESNGRHYFVEHADALPQIFDRELEALSKTVAGEGALSVELAPGVEVLEVYDRVHRVEGSRVSVPLGTFTTGEPKTVLLRVRTPAARSGRHEAAKLTLTYRDLSRDEPREYGGTLAWEATPTAARVSALDPLVDLRLGRSEARSALFEANDLFKRGRRAEAQQVLETARQANAARGAAARAAPTAAPAEVAADLERQRGALDDAYDAFGKGSGAPKANAPAQVRTNADRGVNFGY